ncbi:MAG TPA: O-antigen ligase family protein [Candidatus Solibacter sp.]|nr:O-antigen ligase family protein [Candidatus Solibacter sp.]
MAISLHVEHGDAPTEKFAAGTVAALLRPLQLLMAWPSLWFLLALTAMLLRHPDVAFYEIDRVALGLLVVGVLARAMMQRRRIVPLERIALPMLGLILLTVSRALQQPFENETWSLLASKFIVPFLLFHLAGLVFDEEKRFRHFEIFAALVLAYLSFTSIAFLAGMRSLIFPRFILDESLGFQPERARGPLLQAVANGVSLSILGMLVLHAFRRDSLRGFKIVLLLASIPVAILATMTRTVWFTFAAAVIALIFRTGNRMLKRTCIGVTAISAVTIGFALSCHDFGGVLTDRFEEPGPIDYREAMYAGGWEMFLERPLTGWGFHQMPAELPRHVIGYHEKVLYPHNTYLELLVEHGVIGLALYVWLMWEMWKLGRGAIPVGEEHSFLDRDFHRLWPILLAVYWVNAAMVVMSYQFVNGLLFSLAGMLAAQRRRALGFSIC